MSRLPHRSAADRRTLWPVLALLFALLLPAARPAAGQDAAPAEPAGEAAPAAAEAAPASEAAADDLSAFAEVVEVNVVNVEVYVTDKQGNRVTGLTKDDFEVYQDDKPVEVSNFFVVEAGRPLVEFGTLPLPEAEGPERVDPRIAPRPELPQEQRLSLVVYVDNFNIRPFNRNRVLRELRVFLGEQVSVGDRVMLVSYDRTLRIRRPFTTDPQAVGSALLELETETGHASQFDNDRRQVIERIEDARNASEALVWARSWADEVNNNLRFTLGALKDMVNSLAGLPGRKAILYVSDGIPMVPGQEMFHAVDAKFSGGSAITESFGYDMSRKFRELADQANANRVTFYTIDAAGLRVGESISVENRRAQPVGLDSIATHNVQSPLRYIADVTGGVAIVNRNRVLPHLEQVAQDFNTYYSLGYNAPPAPRGRYHEIDVKVKRKGLSVRHREGYRDKTVEARMSDGTLSALRFELERNPIGASIAFEAPRPRENRFYLVPVKVRIPIANIVQVPRADSWEGRLRLYVAARDDDGDSSGVQQLVVPVSIPGSEIELARTQDYVYSVDLLMRPGPHRVAVGIRDELAGSESFVTRELTVGITANSAASGR